MWKPARATTSLCAACSHSDPESSLGCALHADCELTLHCALPTLAQTVDIPQKNVMQLTLPAQVRSAVLQTGSQP